MFPIPFNFPFRKKDGSVVSISDAMSGGGDPYTLPTASAETKGGVKIGSGLTMNGEVLSATGGGSPYVLPTASAETKGGVKIGDGLVMDGETLKVYKVDYGVYTDLVDSKPRPVFNSPAANKYGVAVVKTDVTTALPSSMTFEGEYDIDDAYNPPVFDIYEFYGDVTTNLINDLGLVLLYDGSQGASSSFELLDDLSDYDAVVINGRYGNDLSSYDTSVIYCNPELNTDYWFGMKDRNSSYTGTVEFTDTTHGTFTASSSRRFVIYGIPKA